MIDNGSAAFSEATIRLQASNDTVLPEASQSFVATARVQELADRA